MSAPFHLDKNQIEKIRDMTKEYEFTHEKILSNNSFQIIKENNAVTLKNYFFPINMDVKRGDYAEIIPTAFKEIKSLLPDKYITLATCSEREYFPDFQHMIFLIADTPVMPKIHWKHWDTKTLDVFNNEDNELDDCQKINPLVVDIILKNVDFYDNTKNKYHLDTLMNEKYNPFHLSANIILMRGQFTPLAFTNKNRLKKNVLIYLGINDVSKDDLLQIGFRDKDCISDSIYFYNLHSKELDDIVYQRNYCDEGFEPIKGLPPQEDVLKYVNYLKSIPIIKKQDK